MGNQGYITKLEQEIASLKAKLKYSDLADMCKIARTKRVLSQKDFAKLIGSTQTEVSFIEAGFIPLQEIKIKKIKKLYNSLWRE